MMENKGGRKKVCFSPSVIAIDIQESINDHKVKWYQIDEMQSFRKDVKNISRAFIAQNLRKKNRNILADLTRSKTMCVLGLESRIDYRRRLQRLFCIHLVLNAQKKFQGSPDCPKLELHLATISRSATSNARRVALEQGRSLSNELCCKHFPLTTKCNVPAEILLLPYLVTSSSDGLLHNLKRPNLDESTLQRACFSKRRRRFSKNSRAA